MGRTVKGQGRAISCTSEPPSLSDYVPKNREGEEMGRVGREKSTRMADTMAVYYLAHFWMMVLPVLAAPRRSFRDPSWAIRREKMEGQRYSLDENHEMGSNGTWWM